MTKLKTAICIVLLFVVTSEKKLKGQDKIKERLLLAGFENLRVLRDDHELYISAEDNIFRWYLTGIKAVLDTVAKYSEPHTRLSLVVLGKGIPKLVVHVSPGLWKEYLLGTVQLHEISDDLEVNYELDGSWNKLKNTVPENSSFSKADLVVYPQFALQNVLVKKIYEIQLNIAPAVEITLQKGLCFTGQVIFPVINDLGFDGDFIRPGFVTLSQQIRLPHQWFGRVTVGNFNASRYGTDFFIFHPLRNNRWSIAMNAGYTGSSRFYHGQWTAGKINVVTWFARGGYYYPKFDLQLDLTVGRYLNNDYGVRADCTRHFGEKTVGFYIMQSGGQANGGFHFSVPLPPVKRFRRRAFRIVPPRFFDWEYNAATEFYYGRYYETRPNENRSEQWMNPIFIKNELLKIYRK